MFVAMRSFAWEGVLLIPGFWLFAWKWCLLLSCLPVSAGYILVDHMIMIAPFACLATRTRMWWTHKYYGHLLVVRLEWNPPFNCSHESKPIFWLYVFSWWQCCEPGYLDGKSAGLVIKRLHVRIPAGMAGEFSSPVSTLYADFYSASVPPPCYRSGT